jgi:ubiquinol-cytochrome c reductase cytochrome c1 subunit
MLDRVKHAARTGLVLCALALLGTAAPAAEKAAEKAGEGEGSSAANWQHWEAGNEITNLASLQRGARNFMGYCAGCHSLKYMRYARFGADLKISDDQLEKSLVAPGDKKTDYVVAALTPADGEAWFGKAPPDLSLMARARGTEYLYQYLKTYYADPKRPTGVNNLALPNTAMPHVLSDLQGVQEAEFSEARDAAGTSEKQFTGFKPGVPGRLTPEQYDEFVRDTVNFLDYVGEPAQAARASVGIWVILFLLVFTGIAFLLKSEYWKDVK